MAFSVSDQGGPERISIMRLHFRLGRQSTRFFLALGAVVLLVAPVRAAPGNQTHTDDTMLMFEDSWPVGGDNDFNDLVIRYNVMIERNAAGGLSRLVLRLTPLAHGATQRNGLALHVPIPAATSHLARLHQVGETPKLTDPVPGESELTFILYQDVRDAFPGAQPGEFINTRSGEARRSAREIVLEIEFPSPLDLAVEAPFDIFIFHTDHYPHQIHLSDFGPTELGMADSAVADLFGSGDDCSDQVCVPEAGSSSDNLDRYYVNNRGIPWALEFPGSSSWAQEGVPLKQGYPGLPQSLDVGGLMPDSWWLQRNALYLFPILAVPGLLPGGALVLLSLMTGLGVWRLRQRLG